MSSSGSRSTEARQGIFGQVRSAIGEIFGGGNVSADQQLTIEVLFGLLGALAQADSIVTTHETDFVNTLMDEESLSTNARRIAKESFDRGRHRQIDGEAEARRVVARFGKGSAQVERLYDALLRLAAADDRIRPRERELLEIITVALGFEPHALDVRLKVIGQAV